MTFVVEKYLMDSAMDLSLRNSAGSSPASLQPLQGISSSSLKLPISSQGVKIVRPIPRPPWSIVWYQNLWTISPSSLNQNESRRESGCDGNSGGEEASQINNAVFRPTERSSFSVLNNLSTNAVHSYVNNSYNCHVPYGSSAEEHQMQQHRLPQFATEKCNILIANDTTTPGCSSVFKAKLTDPSPQDPQNFTTGHKPVLRKEYSSDDDDDDIDSDNSENIVVTTSSSFTTRLERDSMKKSSSTCSMDKSELGEVLSESHYQNDDNRPHQTTAILDVACCDGPVQFKRISNPNFALTVEHNEVSPRAFEDDDGTKMASVPKGTTRQHKPEVKKLLHEMNEAEQADPSISFSSISAVPDGGKSLHFPHQFHAAEDVDMDKSAGNVAASSVVTTHKSYLCIYCNQSFKSLFCYQKHKKRHLNPVSVDITTTTSANSTSYRSSGAGVGTSNKKRGGGVSTGCGDGGGGGGGGGTVGIIPENAKAKTKDLNVQFFPCKKCGCKFPSYYFVHKHRKICH